MSSLVHAALRKVDLRGIRPHSGSLTNNSRACGCNAAKRLSVYFCLVYPLFAVRAANAQEEFVEPFTSWANANRQYGPKVAGTTDDTAELQRALTELETSRHSSCRREAA